MKFNCFTVYCCWPQTRSRHCLCYSYKSHLLESAAHKLTSHFLRLEITREETAWVSQITQYDMKIDVWWITTLSSHFYRTCYVQCLLPKKKLAPQVLQGTLAWTSFSSHNTRWKNIHWLSNDDEWPDRLQSCFDLTLVKHFEYIKLISRINK